MKVWSEGEKTDANRTIECPEWGNVKVSVAVGRSTAVWDSRSLVRFSDMPTSCRCFRQEQWPQSRFTVRVRLQGFSTGVGTAQQLGI
ncbi:MAG: hypothetical protein NTY51_08245 [Deltaproteobacteria bacterium]|nr:hypothetical protein [Deltaproteobacteria bacterium]